MSQNVTLCILEIPNGYIGKQWRPRWKYSRKQHLIRVCTICKLNKCMQWVPYCMKWVTKTYIFRNDAKANVIQTNNKTDESYKITKYQNKNMTFSPWALWSLVYSQNCKYTHEGICNACVKLTHMGRRRVRSQNVLRKTVFKLYKIFLHMLFFNIVFADTLRPSHQFFGNIGTFPGSDLY